jgi:hypothetical protein
MKSKRGTSSDMKTIGCRSFKVAEDAFNSSLMGICRSMHELTNSVNRKADIWVSECKILKSTHDLTKSCGIREWMIRLYSKFGRRDWSINGFAKRHTSPSEDVKNIFVLVQHQTHTYRLNFNTQKVVNIT